MDGGMTVSDWKMFFIVCFAGLMIGFTGFIPAVRGAFEIKEIVVPLDFRAQMMRNHVRVEGLKAEIEQIAIGTRQMIISILNTNKIEMVDGESWSLDIVNWKVRKNNQN